MRVLLQRTTSSNVIINDKIHGQITNGFCLFVGFKEGDNEAIIDKIINKIINLRVFEDENGKMNKSLLDVGGSVLSISQFTLYANCCEGRRPSFTDACNPTTASSLYKLFNNKIITLGINLQEGIFGADMTINIINNGPCTILLDSETLKF